MSKIMGKKWANIDQPTGLFLGVAGPSIALTGIKTGTDKLTEQLGLVVGGGGANTPTGKIAQGGTNSMSESVLVTVV